jgi:hypothetical protein
VVAGDTGEPGGNKQWHPTRTLEDLAVSGVALPLVCAKRELASNVAPRALRCASSGREPQGGKPAQVVVEDLGLITLTLNIHRVQSQQSSIIQQQEGSSAGTVGAVFSERVHLEMHQMCSQGASQARLPAWGACPAAARIISIEPQVPSISAAR